MWASTLSRISGLVQKQPCSSCRTSGQACRCSAKSSCTSVRDARRAGSANTSGGGAVSGSVRSLINGSVFVVMVFAVSVRLKSKCREEPRGRIDSPSGGTTRPPFSNDLRVLGERSAVHVHLKFSSGNADRQTPILVPLSQEGEKKEGRPRAQRRHLDIF